MPTRSLLIPISFCGLIAAGCTTDSSGREGNSVVGSGISETSKGPVLNNLLTTELEGAKGTEVVVSHVTIPPNTSLPKHWHPGEEFAYVLKGSVTLWQKGKRDHLARAGEVVKVPLKQIHTAITDEEGVTLLIFRVHEKGQPERIRVEPQGGDPGKRGHD